MIKYSMGRPPKPLRALPLEEAEKNLAALQARRLAVSEELSRTNDPIERQALLDFIGSYKTELKRAVRQHSDAIGRDVVAKMKAEEKERAKEAKKAAKEAERAKNG